MTLLEALEGLASGEISPENAISGLCLTLIDLGPTENINYFDFVRGASVGWPNHSGDRNYPVPATDDGIMGSAHDQYYCTGDLWSGKQGELRRDLCRYMADKLRAEL